MGTYPILMLLCGLVIFSYLFDIFSRKTKVPSVLLLLATGVGLQLLANAFQLKIVDFGKVLPLLGTIGLILIVLEGALELRYTKEKKRVILQSLGASFFLLLGSSLAIGWLFQYVTDAPFKTCLLNAIPFSTISSAIAIPSVANLAEKKKEFIVYESTFSDILGIMFFNFMTANEEISLGSFVGLTIETVLVLLLAAAFCFALLYLLKRIDHHIKFFLIIALLVLIYAIGKHYHLSTLIIILVFGLFLNNTQIFDFEWFRKRFQYADFNKDLGQLHLLTGESAFLIRTFFFIVFGFTMQLDGLKNLATIGNGLATVGIIYLMRWAYLKFVARVELNPELYVSPRGLISILLFFSLPTSAKLGGIDSSLLLFAILATGLVMTYGLVRGAKPRKEQGENATDL
ncbi:MAG: sodium:proton antiporter [Saprospiraceae bacterium]|nr:sodium:proton antiporter [Saprospiraceae bacterium]